MTASNLEQSSPELHGTFQKLEEGTNVNIIFMIVSLFWLTAKSLGHGNCGDILLGCSQGGLGAVGGAPY